MRVAAERHGGMRGEDAKRVEHDAHGDSRDGRALRDLGTCACQSDDRLPGAVQPDLDGAQVDGLVHGADRLERRLLGRETRGESLGARRPVPVLDLSLGEDPAEVRVSVSVERPTTSQTSMRSMPRARLAGYRRFWKGCSTRGDRRWLGLR